MAFRPQESEVNNVNNSCKNSKQKPSIPLSAYANKLEEKVKKRYIEKISAIGIDLVLIEGKLRTRLLTSSGIDRPTVVPCFGDGLLHETAI